MVSQTAPPPPLPHAAFALATALEMEAKRRASSPHKVHQATNASGRAVRRPRHARDPFGSAIDPLAGALGLIWDSDRDPGVTPRDGVPHSTGATRSSGDGEVPPADSHEPLGPVGLPANPPQSRASQNGSPGCPGPGKLFPVPNGRHVLGNPRKRHRPPPPARDFGSTMPANQGDMTMTEEAVAAMEPDRPPAVAEGILVRTKQPVRVHQTAQGAAAVDIPIPPGQRLLLAVPAKVGVERLTAEALRPAPPVPVRRVVRPAATRWSCHPHPVRARPAQLRLLQPPRPLRRRRPHSPPPSSRIFRSPSRRRFRSPPTRSPVGRSPRMGDFLRPGDGVS